jgi:hypothetical protein
MIGLWWGWGKGSVHPVCCLDRLKITAKNLGHQAYCRHKNELKLSQFDPSHSLRHPSTGCNLILQADTMLCLYWTSMLEGCVVSITLRQLYPGKETQYTFCGNLGGHYDRFAWAWKISPSRGALTQDRRASFLACCTPYPTHPPRFDHPHVI